MIRNIWAVGRNYGKHAKEMGAPIPSRPMIFLKAGSCAVTGRDVPLFAASKDVHHELEIALRFGSKADAKGLLFDGAAVALDLTARDIQSELKANAHPWSLAKSFRASCPVSPMTALPEGPVPHFKFDLKVNDEIRQKGDTHDMVFDFETLRRYVLEHFPVEPGDLLLTGTPEGVAALKAGDKAVASFESADGHRGQMEWVFR